jgi:hypothetical protein
LVADTQDEITTVLLLLLLQQSNALHQTMVFVSILKGILEACHFLKCPQSHIHHIP